MSKGPRDDDKPDHRPPQGGLRGVSARCSSWRTALTLLIGSGLTVGPLASGASGAEAETPSSTGTTPTTPTGPTTTTSPPPTTTTTPTTSGETTPQTPPGQSTSSTTSSTPSSTTTTTTTSATSPPAASPPPSAGAESPAIIVKRKQPATPGGRAGHTPAQTKTTTSTAPAKGAPQPGAPAAPSGPNNVALPPQLVAGQAGALAALLGGTNASAQALDFYRIPLFLLPIYRAAAAQYDVPWPILAAINEIETNYGADLSVSSAGAEGWMQFEPGTWLQYGVDALNAGYADPYNPVDAIFAAARYLNVAGAAANLRGAIFAYNHSEAYVESVLLRAKLIAAYPGQVIATLTGLIDGRPPVTGKRIGWTLPPASAAAPTTPALPPSSNATAGASPATASGPAAAAASAGSPSAPSPSAAASASAAGARSAPLQLADVTSEPRAQAVAVQDGRVIQLGRSRKLGDYVILQDVYGDLFTYAHLGSLARTFTPSHSTTTPGAASNASASTAVALAATSSAGAAPSGATTGSAATSGQGKVRVFARPGNPDALAALRASANAARLAAGQRALLRSGAVVPEGTVLGQVATPPGAKDGHLRFAIRPTGDGSTIDPRPILANWTQLDTALHPQGAKGHPGLLGATASDVFLLSKSELERAVLSDPGIGLSACSRHEVATGAVDRRALAMLAFLSRSGLRPSIGTLRCEPGTYATNGYVAPGHTGDAVALVAINGIPIAGHQGAGSITDTTIRTLLTLQDQYAPARIASLMRYPGAPTTLATPDHGDYIEVAFTLTPPRSSGSGAATTAPGPGTPGSTGAPAAGSSQSAGPVALAGDLTPTQWEQLFARIAALPTPTVATKPSSAAIPDAKSAAASGGRSSP